MKEQKILFGLLGTKQVPVEKSYWNVETDTFTMISRNRAEIVQMAILIFSQPESVRLQVSMSANQYLLRVLHSQPVPASLQKLVDEGLISPDKVIPTSTKPDKAISLTKEHLWQGLHELLETESYLWVGAVSTRLNKCTQHCLDTHRTKDCTRTSACSIISLPCSSDPSLVFYA